MLLVHFTICKGVGDEWLLRQLVREIEDFGRSDIIFKTDGEPAIVAVQSRIQSDEEGEHGASQSSCVQTAEQRAL